jgi:acetyl esterase/lipase
LKTQGRSVPENAPPLFAVVAQDDFVVYRMIESLYSDWTDAGRSAELHIYRRGNHGFGMLKQGTPSDRWINLFHEWLADQGLAQRFIDTSAATPSRNMTSRDHTHASDSRSS